MLYNLIQTRRGKREVVMTDSLPNVNNRKKTLLTSHRRGIKGSRVEYSVEPSEDNKKFQKKPHAYNIGGSDAKIPLSVRKGKK